MPAPATDREDILEKLCGAFQRWGYDGASLARLSEETGLVKASLYHYFPGGKQEMGNAVLDWLGNRFAQQVVAPLRREIPTRILLSEMGAHLSTFYANGEFSCLLEIFTLGSARELFGPRIQQSMNRLRQELAQVLIRHGLDAAHAVCRAERAMVAIQGALVVSRGIGEKRVFVSTMEMLPEMLLGPA